ncbi:MAG: hypothetical protein ABIN91_21100 [Mucilaginibacter sp.]|uniref:hypothetical protein n=1 Tax=Mucilaginibacter sp. TaxID=1882438 RepID=UPI003267AB14
MPKVIITGWRYGLQKISLTKLQADSLNMGLKESKKNVTDILDGKQVEFDIPDIKVAKKFMLEAEWLGANCTLIE